MQSYQLDGPYSTELKTQAVADMKQYLISDQLDACVHQVARKHIEY